MVGDKQTRRKPYEKNENCDFERAPCIAAPLPQIAAGEKNPGDNNAQENQNQKHASRSA